MNKKAPKPLAISAESLEFFIRETDEIAATESFLKTRRAELERMSESFIQAIKAHTVIPDGFVVSIKETSKKNIAWKQEFIKLAIKYGIDDAFGLTEKISDNTEPTKYEKLQIRKIDHDIQ